LSRSNAIQTVVGSDAGSPSQGLRWVKPPAPGVCQTFSERTPSIVMGSVVGIAAIVRTVRGSVSRLIWEAAAKA
jgi:hypothetical protein